MRASYDLPETSPTFRDLRRNRETGDETFPAVIAADVIE